MHISTRLASVVAFMVLDLSCAKPDSGSAVKFEDSHLLQLGESRAEFLLEPVKICSKTYADDAKLGSIKASDEKFVLQFYVTGDANKDTSGTAPIRYTTDANGVLKYWTLIVSKRQLESATLSVLASEAVGIKAMTSESLLGIVCTMAQAASNQCTPPNTAALEDYRSKVRSGACGDANAEGSDGRLKTSCKESLFKNGGAFVGIAYPINVRSGGFVSGDVTMPLLYDGEPAGSGSFQPCASGKTASLALNETKEINVESTYTNTIETVKHKPNLPTEAVPSTLADTATINATKEFDTVGAANKTKQDSLAAAAAQGASDTAKANALQGEVGALEGQVSAIETQKKIEATTAIISSGITAAGNLAASMPPLSLGNIGSPGSECFVEGTLIQVEKQNDDYGEWKPIEKIKVGDRIIDPFTRQAMRVTELVINPYKNTLYTVHAGSGKDALVVTVTDEHPFFSRGGLVAASSLKEGTEVLTARGYLPITKLDASEQGTERKVYNLIHESSKTAIARNVTSSNGFVTGLFTLQNELSKLKQDAERLDLELQKAQNAGSAAQQQIQTMTQRKATLESRLAQLNAAP